MTRKAPKRRFAKTALEPAKVAAEKNSAISHAIVKQAARKAN